MGFVADDEIEVIHVMQMLGFADDINGMVSGEDNAEVLGIVGGLHFKGEPPGIGRGGVIELVGESLDNVLVAFSFFTDLGIGTDGKGMQGSLRLLGPFGEGLGKQGQTGNEKENATIFSHHLLGDLQSGEGFAGATRHDELSAIGIFETELHMIDGASLVIAGIVFFFEDGFGIGSVF